MVEDPTPVIVGVGRVEGACGAEEPIDLVALAACILGDDSRAWARLSDPGDIQAMLASDPIGQSVDCDGPAQRLA